jgi:hypothetical protein
MIGCESQLLFYKILFFYFQRIILSSPSSISVMQASSPCYAHKDLLKNIFYFENLFYV